MPNSPTSADVCVASSASVIGPLSPASSQWPTGLSSAATPFCVNDASRMPAIVLVTEPIRNLPLCGQPLLALTA
jgi:hypothetical protein